ncbi:uncharacterized protein I303_108111 [Kwoniella dejecticola CBS 10117]|uniref:Major facilitator superfamily (MFS) profile domain-containing protein n=1 Tax=Kwoniella dejecticola CBS 10117 TaxID=1296121 RepID=A0A1A5ZWK2_9TREE|nr:uncharacterized protein I303_08102 [Kwoniella dejecticola CBS 10117]OBR82188.1 hypothetical protein I303_08102 [Kwoniella dejecticola CBS 10117]
MSSAISTNEKDLSEHVEVQYDGHANPLEKADRLDGAVEAERLEHAMTIWESVFEYKGAVFWSFIVSMCIVMEGYDLALVGNLIALEGFRERYGEYVNAQQGYQISAAWQSAVTQAPTIGAVFGVLASAQAASHFGYKWTLQASMVLMFGAIFIVFFSNSLPVLFAGQFVSGIPWGAFSVIPTAYASEVAPIRLRAVLTTYVQLCWCIGQFIASGVLYGVKDITTEWSYKIPFAVQWAWPAPMLVILLFAPESPWYLVRKGKLEAAAKVVKRLGRAKRENPEEVVAMMVRTNEIESKTMAGATYKECFKGAELRRTLIVCAVHAGANLTGLLVSNLGTYFFVVAGLPNDKAYGLGLGNTGVQFVAVLCSVFLSSRFGRRTLVLWGLGFNILVMALMGILACVNQSSGVQWAQGILVIIIGLQWGLTLGPMCWTIVGETASLRLRAMTIGLSRDAYYVSSVAFGILNAYMLNPTGWALIGKTAFFYLGTASMLFVAAYFYLPEMRGRSYRELDILFHRRISARQFSKTVIGELDDE